MEEKKIKSFISEKRSASAKRYKTSNTAFLNAAKKSNESVNVVFQSSLSPMLILSGNKADIYSVANNADVVSMDLFVNSEIRDASIEANQNSYATYMRDTLGATGTYVSNGSTQKIKIGQVESGFPDLDNYSSYFNTANCHINDDVYPNIIKTEHATFVAAIMVGKAFTYNGKTYKGIAPDAELHSSAAFNFLHLYNEVEYLVIGCEVDIINMSASCGIPGVYEDISQWIDHIAYRHDVHFVTISGNTDISPDKYVTSPGMAYNAITVGNFQNKNAFGDRYVMTSHAPSILQDQDLDDRYFKINDTSCYITTNGQCKPDISAEGTDITYGAFTNTGTSLAAPQVTGIIAQLCSKYPSLLTKQNTVKAILAASAVYRVDDEYCSNTYLLNKQGAGVVNSRAAYAVLLGGKYMDVTIPNTTQYYTKTITLPSNYTYLRVAMAWIKKNDANGDFCALGDTEANNYQPLANLKLEVFEGTGTSGTRVAYSDASNNNLELLQFVVNGGGTYTIRITNQSYNNSSITGNQYISLAWY